MTQANEGLVDVFLIPKWAWETWKADAYTHLTEEKLEFREWEHLPIEYCKFRTKYGGRLAFAFQIEAKRMDYTAVITKSILDHFSTGSLRITRMIMLGFCGTLKPDEFKVGDIGIAAQVDCYMEKAKIADIKKIDLCGEVYRPSQKYVRIAQNLKHADPEGFKAFQAGCLTRRARDIDGLTQSRMDRDSIGIHTPHLASATLLSTSAGAVKWLRGRDRRLFMIDMESGGMMAAVWAHNQNHPDRQVATLVIRAASDVTDEDRENLKSMRRTLQKHAVENVCHFLSWMFGFEHRDLGRLTLPPDAQAGIVVPLEEEFGYFLSQLGKRQITPHYYPPELRFFYSFDMDSGGKCVCTFMGDMGLVTSSLTTAALLNACSNLKVMVQVGIAGSIHPNILVCDVAVATEIDPYLQGAESGATALAALKPFKADEKSIEASKQAFRESEEAIRAHYSELLRAIESLPPKLIPLVRPPEKLQLHCVPFASGDAVAADVNLHEKLQSGGRNNKVVDMESGGMHVMAEAAKHGGREVKTLFFRGISDNASSDKSALDAIHPAGILRKIAMRNASYLVVTLLTSAAFWKTIQESSGAQAPEPPGTDQPLT